MRINVATFGIVLGMLGASAVAQTPDTHPEKMEEPADWSLTEDLAKAPTFTFQIAPSLPEFTFKVVPDLREPDPGGNAQSVVQSVLVYSPASNGPSQSLQGCGWNEMAPPPAHSDWFRAEDFNFDGYLDIYALTSWGATGNSFGCVWLFDAESSRFIYSKELSDNLCQYRLDAKSKTIFTFENGGAAGQEHSARTYLVDRGHLVLVWSEMQEWVEEKKQFHCVIKERRGKDFQVVRDAFGGPNDSGPPCDPAALFR